MVTTLKDVAKQAGVSIKTVSNVVNGRPFVAAETRERVSAAIAALNYRPNVAARHLRTTQAGVLALAIPDLSNPYFTDLGYAVIAAAKEQGYTVLLDHTGADRAQEALVAKGLRPHLIDGVILDAQALQVGDLVPGPASLPTVLLGECIIDGPRDHVMIDNVAAAHQATSHLLSLGRRRVAAIGVIQPEVPGSAAMRWQGFLSAHEAAGVPVDPALIDRVTTSTRADGAAAMRRLLALPSPPDAVFCFNDLLAVGALRALYELGCRVPDDVAVAGFDDIEDGRFANPSLTTIAPDKVEIGRLAVDLLLQRIRGTRSGPPERFEPPFRLLVRESTAGRSAGAAPCDNPCERR